MKGGEKSALRGPYDASCIPSVRTQVGRIQARLGLTRYRARVVEHPMHADAEGYGVFPFLYDLADIWGVHRAYDTGYSSVAANLWNQMAQGVSEVMNSDILPAIQAGGVWLEQRTGGLLDRLEGRTMVKTGIIFYHAIPISAGLTWAGQSAEASRVRAASEGKLLLGSVQGLSLSIGWPERFASDHQLGLVLAGDMLELQPGEDDSFAWVTDLSNDDGWLRLGGNPATAGREGFGPLIAYPADFELTSTYDV